MRRLMVLGLGLLPGLPNLAGGQKSTLPATTRWTVATDSVGVAASLVSIEQATRPDSPALRVSCDGRVARMALQFAAQKFPMVSLIGDRALLSRFDGDARQEVRAEWWPRANELQWPAEASRYVPLLLTRDWLIVRFTGERGYQEVTYDLGDAESALRAIVGRCPSLSTAMDSTLRARPARGPQRPMPSAANTQERLGDWVLLRIANRFDDSKTVIATASANNASVLDGDIRLYIRSLEGQLEAFVSGMLARDTVMVQLDEGEWRPMRTRGSGSGADFFLEPLELVNALRGHAKIRMRTWYKKTPLEFTLARSEDAIKPVLAASGRSP